VTEHARPVRLDVLVQLNPAGAGREEISEPRLALLERKRPLILVVQFEQVKREQDDVAVAAA
jgi:hypothetical protein